MTVTDVATTTQLVGTTLARLREQRGISQSELARNVGLNRNSLARIEAGERGIARETLLALGAALQLRSAQIDTLCLVAGHAPTAATTTRLLAELRGDGPPPRAA